MHQFYRIVLWDHREEMHCLIVLCLLSAAVALPTSEQLRTNLPALASPPELKSEEKDHISDEQVVVEPIPSLLEDALEPEEAMNPSESAETPKAEKEEDKDKLGDVSVMQKESKESKESKDSKESEEPWESKEFEKIPEPPKLEMKEKDSKLEGSKEEDGPIIVQVLQKPSQNSWMPIQSLNNLKPPGWLSYIYNLITSKFENGHRSMVNGQQDQPIYIVRESDWGNGQRSMVNGQQDRPIYIVQESDFAFDDRN